MGAGSHSRKAGDDFFGPNALRQSRKRLGVGKGRPPSSRGRDLPQRQRAGLDSGRRKYLLWKDSRHPQKCTAVARERVDHEVRRLAGNAGRVREKYPQATAAKIPFAKVRRARVLASRQLSLRTTTGG